MQSSDIRYTQSSIFTRFTVNGEPVYLEGTFRELLNGRLTADAIECIEVVFKYGVWWVLSGNKRLFMYKKLQKLGIICSIPVIIRQWSSFQVRKLFKRRHTTQCSGRHIECVEKENVVTGADVRIRQMRKSWCQKRRLDPDCYLTSDDDDY